VSWRLGKCVNIEPDKTTTEGEKVLECEDLCLTILEEGENFRSYPGQLKLLLRNFT